MKFPCEQQASELSLFLLSVKLLQSLIAKYAIDLASRIAIFSKQP